MGLCRGYAAPLPVAAPMLMKELCSYPWVRDTYGAQLPACPGSRCPAPFPSPRRSAPPVPDVTAPRQTGAVDYEPAGELKIGQVGIANLRVRTLDVAKLGSEMRDRVARAPKLFARAAVVVDFGGLPGTPDAATATRVARCAARCRRSFQLALAWGSSDNEQLAVTLGLPLLAKFRAQYEPVGDAPVASAPAAKPAPKESAAEVAPESADYVCKTGNR